ncbi:hypothetical protein RND71_003487 [Anisodus tanguticus]|uniref:Uncharacterized protein n=1 Tax=Anisodus tanguticus TaxID=243964 RepID=A0AAE1SWR4_9SOLA|nr:hypothetical protein RND71_003487 [Anisodus tanguticus]
MATPWDAHLKPLSGQCEKEISDVNIRMEGFLVSYRANDALLALPTRQGKDKRRASAHSSVKGNATLGSKKKTGASSKRLGS